MINAEIEIGNFISSARKHKQVSQVELSKMLKISQQTLSTWENGTRRVHISEFVKLINILEIPKDEYTKFLERLMVEYGY